MDELMLDGNAVAGLLREVSTTTRAMCQMGQQRIPR